METVDNEDCFCGFRGILCRQHLCGETATASVDSYHLEMIELVGFQLHVIAVLGADIGAVVEVCLSDGGIEDIAGRFGRRFLRVVDGIPAEPNLILAFEVDAKTVGG